MAIDKTLPSSGYYAVIFCSEKSADTEGYAEMDEATMRLAAEVPGFLGYESVKEGNRSIFISYWETMAAIEVWKENATHKSAKNQARRWYRRYLSQVCRVESSRQHEFND